MCSLLAWRGPWAGTGQPVGLQEATVKLCFLLQVEGLLCTGSGEWAL